MPVRVRFAPSPTGSPHIGSLRTAIFDWLLSHKEGGSFVLRLEDTDRDPTRYQPNAIPELADAIRFMGIEPDEWWVTGGPYGPYVQSERLDLYHAAADELIARGQAYRCYCTEERLAEMRAQQQAEGVPSGYDRHCRSLPPGERARLEAEGAPYTVRLAVPLEGRTSYHDLVYGEVSFENRLIDDQVLLKSSGWPTYHLAVVVDDHAMAITHVLRGEEWMPSTPKQVLLYQAFGWDEPIWCHLPLIVGADKKKLSKRHGSTQFHQFIREGYLPEALFNFLVLLGWSAGEENRELFTRDEILERFSLEGITRHAAVFDFDKLRWMNGEYIRKADPARIVSLCMPYLSQAGLVADPPTEEERAYAAKVLPLAIDRLRVLSEIAPLVDFFFVAPTEPDEKGRRKWLVGDQARAILERAAEAFSAAGGAITETRAEEVVDAVAEQLGIARAPVIHTLRVAVTGRTVGPGLFETLTVLGSDRVVQRLRRAGEWVQ